MFDQCGGKAGSCYNFCGDFSWPAANCPAASSCYRQNEWYWMCSGSKAAGMNDGAQWWQEGSDVVVEITDTGGQEMPPAAVGAGLGMDMGEWRQAAAAFSGQGLWTRLFIKQHNPIMQSVWSGNAAPGAAESHRWLRVLVCLLWLLLWPVLQLLLASVLPAKRMLLLPLLTAVPGATEDSSTWGQCGGMSGNCQSECMDAAWSWDSCPDTYTCTRSDAWFWQCRPGGTPGPGPAPGPVPGPAPGPAAGAGACCCCRRLVKLSLLL